MRRRGKLTHARVDLENRIVAEVLCIKCGHDLRGTLVDEPCAECGHPASDSVYGDYLIYSDPAEARRLLEATRLLIFAAVVVGLLFAVATLVLIVRAASPVDAIQRAHDMLFAGVLLFPVIAATGIALLTRRHEAAYFEAKYGSPWALARLLILLVILLVVVIIAARCYPAVMRCCLLVAWGTILPAVFFRGLAQLMRRMPNVRLANFARGACVGVWVLGALTLLYQLLRTHAASKTEIEGPLLALQVVISWGWLCLGLASYRLLVLVRRNLEAILRG